MGPTITVTKRLSGLTDFKAALVSLRNAEVLVGIPQARSSRRGEKINNAELLYIHTHGSPARNIPARPVIEPAINAPGNREQIAAELKDAAVAWLRRDPKTGLKYLKHAGMAGMDAAKAWFTDPRNGWAPNTRATVLAKLRRLKGTAHADALAEIAGMDKIGTVTDVNTVLVDTGVMRGAITYVIRGITFGSRSQTEVEQLEATNARKALP